MKYSDVEDAVKKEVMDANKFEKVETTADKHILTVWSKVAVAENLQRNNIISQADKTLITGLTEKNKPKQAPEYRAESPYAYPSFKVHKLSPQDIEEKKIPPARLIHASKFGPAIQMWKMVQPPLNKNE